jgi:peptide deformylase
MNATNLKIRFYGDPILRTKALNVDSIGPAERMLIGAMFDTMRLQKGVGLAAPQVGIGRRIFVTDVGDGGRAFINPKIVRKSGNAVMEEGCLSIPGVNIGVKRAEKIWVKFTDENNYFHECFCEGLLARVVQHELDHLDGKLIVDYASKKEFKSFEMVLHELGKKARPY